MATKRTAINVIDDLGQRTVVYEITSEISVGTFADPHAKMSGLAEYRLADGTPLNVIRGGFEIPGGKRRFMRT
ncbi:hypothetical protein ABZR86_02450 [Dyella marensis]|uniref:Uncharacterized protein n=1 Tax=Dyella marensis TaxID=500610 RepID=A0A1I2A0A1_9GAMM|nr:MULTISPECIES: hypothetical protein [Dyella]SFE37524.1 hypothetical protein SAMN02799615_00883 [Dyella marensis]